jgi:hypothetical protein
MILTRESKTAFVIREEARRKPSEVKNGIALATISKELSIPRLSQFRISFVHSLASTKRSLIFGVVDFSE